MKEKDPDGPRKGEDCDIPGEHGSQEGKRNPLKNDVSQRAKVEKLANRHNQRSSLGQEHQGTGKVAMGLLLPLGHAPELGNGQECGLRILIVVQVVAVEVMGIMKGAPPPHPRHTCERASNLEGIIIVEWGLEERPMSSVVHANDKEPHGDEGVQGHPPPRHPEHGGPQR
jgi:hypothetical protein